MKKFIENPYQVVHRIEAWDKISPADIDAGKSVLNHEGGVESIVFNNLNLYHEIPIVSDECLGLFQVYKEIFGNIDSTDSSSIDAWSNYNFLTKFFVFTNVTENEFFNYKELGVQVLSIDDLLIEAALGPETQKVS